jgi:hypothetical protein
MLRELVIVIALALLIGAWGIFYNHGKSWDEIWLALAPEMVGIAITVFAIEELYRWADQRAQQRVEERLAEERKRNIIAQMRSPARDFAPEATRQVKRNGWLYDGSLRGKFLANVNWQDQELWTIRPGGESVGADLQDAILGEANLRRALLWNANLQGADLRRAKLQDIQLAEGDLRGAGLKWADLQGADLDGAKLEGVILEGARFDDDTKWPDGFSKEMAEALGAKKVVESDSLSVDTPTGKVHYEVVQALRTVSLAEVLVLAVGLNDLLAASTTYEAKLTLEEDQTDGQVTIFDVRYEEGELLMWGLWVPK